MDNQQRRSILCPNCRRLISIDESPCPYCGLARPGSRWKNNFWTRGLLEGEQFIKIVIVVNAVMFLLSIVLNPGSTSFSMNPFALLAPGNRSLLLLGATGRFPIEQLHRWWSVLSASYLHGGILHILFNMMAFRQIAPLVFQEFGGYRTMAIYTLSGVGGFVMSYLAGIPFTLGASAAICGLIGAALYYGKSRGGQFGQMIFQQLGGWAVGILIFGLLFPGIDNWAHGGGLACGILSAWAMGYRERRAESYVHKAAAGLCVAATAGSLLWAVGTALWYLLQLRPGS